MAENKRSFLLYADFANIFYELTDEEAGQLIKHLFKYVNDENPVMDNRLLKIVFEPIKLQLKRDLKQWEQTIQGRSDGGSLGNLKRWHKDLYLKVIKKKITLEQGIKIAKDRSVSVSDNTDRSVSHSIAPVAVTDTVTDTVVDYTSTLFSWNDFLNTVGFSDDQFALHITRSTGKTIPQLVEYKKLFLDEQKALTKLSWPNINDAKKHFVNWVKKQPDIISRANQFLSGN